MSGSESESWSGLRSGSDFGVDSVQCLGLSLGTREVL